MAKKKKKAKRAKKAGSKKPAQKKKPAKKKLTRKKKVTRKKARIREENSSIEIVAVQPKGMGARSGGQSGDIQGLSGLEVADSQSVVELIEEGQAFEAEVVSGVENVPDEAEVTTSEVPEDDVPPEYRDKE
jgi:hypothetical protein